MLISVIIYYHAGPSVASPALGSASPLVSKVCFGIALPTIIVAGVVNGSVATKYIYFRVWKGTSVAHANSWLSLGSWGAICTGAWLTSWILAEAVPNFTLLLGLMGALFGSWFSCESLLTRPGRMKIGVLADACRCTSSGDVAVAQQEEP